MDTSTAPSARLSIAAVAAVALIAALLASSTAVYASNRYSDVASTNVFHDEINWMTDTRISEGYGDGTFRPGAAVTRDAMAAFMQRFYNLQAGLTATRSGSGGTTSSTSMVNVASAAVSVTIPAGTTGQIVSWFSADAACNGGKNQFAIVMIPTRCQVRLTVNGAQMSPGVLSFGESVNAADTDLLVNQEANTVMATTSALPAGTYTIRAQQNVSNSTSPTPIFELAEWNLVAQVQLQDAA